MPLFLRPDVHAAVVNEDLVLLDVAADRYMCLSGAAEVVALSRDRGELETDDHDLGQRLAEAGLLLASGSFPTQRTPAPPKAERSALPAEVPSAAVRDLAPAAATLLDTFFHYHRRPFASIVQAGLRPRADPPRATPALEAAVQRFHAWVPYAPLSAQCLLRAFMLLRLLRRQGLDALWVFGVQTWPFHAHCWLQAEDMVLDDPAERVSAYTPILVV